MSTAAPGSLVDIDDVPHWLRDLVAVAETLDARAFTRFAPSADDEVRPAAVLVLLSDGSDGTAESDGSGADVLLLRRSETMAAHAGQVAFPGGSADADDTGPVHTALREGREETGLDPDGVRPLALLPQLYVPVSGYGVTPVLAHWQRPSAVHAVDPAETAAVARVPIGALTDPDNRFVVARQPDGWRGPAFSVDGMLIWGFTAGVLSVLLGLAGWERPWDTGDVRPLDVTLREHGQRLGPVPRSDT